MASARGLATDNATHPIAIYITQSAITRSFIGSTWNTNSFVCITFQETQLLNSRSRHHVINHYVIPCSRSNALIPPVAPPLTRVFVPYSDRSRRSGRLKLPCYWISSTSDCAGTASIFVFSPCPVYSYNPAPPILLRPSIRM